MVIPPFFQVRPDVADALGAGRPVVALESTVIAHGLPWPTNLETAREAEAAIRAEGVTAATIGIRKGVPIIGLSDVELEEFAHSPGIRKASRRDLASAIAQKANAATTVAATMYLAHRVGIRLFATGGIGGAHPAAAHGNSWDVSGDLEELSRTPVAVVCAGAKSILDLPATLEMLESLGVPVVGYGISEFPAFYVETSGLPVSARVDSVEEAAALLDAHWRLDGAGVVLAQPISADDALNPVEFDAALTRARELATRAHIRGPALTPFLLARLAELTNGQTLIANQSLLEANARLAAQVARRLSSLREN